MSAVRVTTVHVPALGALLAVVAMGCGSGDGASPLTPPSENPAAVAVGPVLPPHASAATPTVPTGTTGKASRLFVRLDPAFRGCTDDAGCQVISDCACRHCIPSRQMHVSPCPTVCNGDPCTGRRPRCLANVCVAEGLAIEGPTAEVVEAVRAAGQLVLDDPRFVAHLHPEQPGRLPLTVAWEPGLVRPAWKAGGQPVRFVDGLPTGTHLAPRTVDAEAHRVRFELAYEVEGVTVNAEAEVTGGAPRLTSFQLTER